MRVGEECSTAISDLSEGVCSCSETLSSPNASIGGIVGGTTAGAAVLLVVVTVIVIIALILALRKRSGCHFFKETEE